MGAERTGLPSITLADHCDGQTTNRIFHLQDARDAGNMITTPSVSGNLSDEAAPDARFRRAPKVPYG